jgi:hypothetical protein
MLLDIEKMRSVVGNRARRGSILVLVLGILAMMAVLAAVYLAIGVGDQRSAKALETRQEQLAVAPVIGEYIADIIAKDRLATIWRAGSNDSGVISQAYRETTDFPYTDYTRLSIPELSGIAPSQRDIYRFNSEGTQRVQWPGLPLFNPDPRVVDDSFLASTEPTFLGAPSEREQPTDPTKWWLDNRDWAHISNLAPDGLFVNLFALRNNFNAPRGIQNNNEMSFWLSLIKQVPTGSGGFQLRATDATTGETHIPGLSISPLEMRNRPYFWTMNQRNMFFPIGQAFTMLDPAGGTAGWGSPYYPDYQYADADGDGFADSRWFELKDSTIFGRELNLLSNSGDYRMFFAARVIDLSALVNVNTASDGSVAPTSQTPLGATPAEIDIRRLLTMADLSLVFGSSGSSTGSYTSEVGGLAPGTPLGYTSIPRPINAGTASVEDPASDYSMYGYEFVDPDLGVPNAAWVGWFGYDALHRSFGIPSDLWASSGSSTLPTDLRGLVLPNITSYDAGIDLIPISPFEFTYALESQGETLQTLTDMDRRALTRAQRYLEVGITNPLKPNERPVRTVGGQEVQPERFGTELFGLADLSELLTYRGLNDPASTSRLESAIDSRYEDGETSSFLTTRRFGPLRSNRALEFERQGHDDTTRGSEFGFSTGSNGVVDGDAMALMALSPRSRLTTLSGAADLTGVSPLSGTASRLSTRLQFQEAKPLFKDVAQNILSSFNIYRRAMAPYSNIDTTWDPAGTPNFDRYRTLFYGYGGPEFAIRSAAHMAVNLRDQYDTDSSSTVATVALTNPSGVAFFDTPPTGGPNDPSITANQRRMWPGWVNGNRMSLSQADANNRGVGQIEADFVNVYGIEPQPFIVEAMSINVYTDAPNVASLPPGEPNGDIDFNPASCQPPPRPGMEAVTVEITIGGKLKSGDWGSKSLWGANPDFVMQVFAVKLHNPFNVPIILGRGASGPRQTNCDPSRDTGPLAFDYYLEFGGRYFKLAQYIPPNAAVTNPRYSLAPVTINPGSSRVFYVLAQEDEEAIVARWSRYLNAYGGVGQGLRFSDIQNWLEAQFDMKKLSGSNRPIWIRRFNPETGLINNLTGVCDVDPDDISDVSDRRLVFDDLWELPRNVFPSTASGGVAREPEWQVVRLWKKVSAGFAETQWNGASQLQLTDNWIENDQLIDRLREPNPQALNIPNPGQYPNPSDRLGHLDSRANYAGGYGFSNTGGVSVTGTIGCEQTLASSIGGFRNDNTGWTIAMHSLIRRQGFDSNWAARIASGNNQVKRGVLPIWCFESVSSTVSSTQDRIQNIIETESDNRHPSGTLRENDFVFNRPWIFRRFREFIRETNPVENSFDEAPSEWAGPTRLRNLLNDELYGKVFAANAPRPFGTRYLFPELHVRNDKFEFDPPGTPEPIDISRVTDILTPMAIGPEYDPLGDPGFDGGVDDDNDIKLPGRYLTLSEAFALALGYDQLDLEDVDSDGIADGDDTLDDTIYNRFAFFDAYRRKAGDRPGQPASGEFEYAFDRFQLWLDKFVPFVDTNTDGFFDPTLDVRLGEGVTPAMKLLDSVQTLTDANTNTVLGRAIPGRININTASLTTLRTIGMLSPNSSWDPFGVPENWAWRMANQYGSVAADSGSFNIQPYVDWTRTNLGLPDLSLMDSAPTIMAYRDRLRQIEYRLSSMPPSLQGVGATLQNYGFVSEDDPLDPGDIYVVQPNEEALAFENHKNDFGRQMLTGITALREMPGFSSPGELIAARFRSDLDDVFDSRRMPFTGAEVAPNQLDYLGRDTRQANPIALKTYEFGNNTPQAFRTLLESRLYADYNPFTNSTYNRNKVYFGDEIGNDYDEQLVLTSQLMNLVTTRSDLFAVWFIVRGYTEADVSNLRGDVNTIGDPSADPMLPSLEKRYLMIVDRSKVGTWIDRNGDGIEQEESEIVSEPEIVLLREIPM